MLHRWVLALMILARTTFRSTDAFSRSALSSTSVLRTAFVLQQSPGLCRASRSRPSPISQRAVTDMSGEVVSEKKFSSAEAYKILVEKLSSITQLQRAQNVLEYDRMVFMPQRDATSSERGSQLAALAEIIHEKTTSPDLKALMDSIQESDLLAEGGEDGTKADASRLLELERKHFEQHSRITTELAKKKASLSASAYAAWVKARQNNDFDGFAPVLHDCFDTAMQIADAQRGDSKERSLYAQMLDEFETGMDPTRINDVFDKVQESLVPLLAKVMKSPNTPSKMPLTGNFPITKQKELSERLVTAIGFDKDVGRIDVSVHPFTMSFSPHDVRITSRFRRDEWYQGLAGTLHEGGHAIYEQNLKSSALSIDTPLSMGAHESQSLFWERHVGLSRAFCKWATPILKDSFEDFDYSFDEVYAAINAVSPSLIRVEADELTYPLHVILRYQMERDVVEGNLDVKFISQRWKDDMKSLLNMDVPSDAQGCLQDVHWSALAFGYFPTYLIGSVTAAQLAHYCHRDIPDMDERIEQGDFSDIKAWLTDKVHRHGKRYSSLDAMLEDQLGEKLNPRYFIDYLTKKYIELYDLASEMNF